MNGTFSKVSVSLLSSSPPMAKALPLAQLDLGLHFADGDGGNGESGNRHGISKVQRADLRGDLEPDRIARSDRRNEVEADAVSP